MTVFYGSTSTKSFFSGEGKALNPAPAQCLNKLITTGANSQVVRKGGLEPPSPKATVSKTAMYTIPSFPLALF